MSHCLTSSNLIQPPPHQKINKFIVIVESCIYLLVMPYWSSWTEIKILFPRVGFIPLAAHYFTTVWICLMTSILLQTLYDAIMIVSSNSSIHFYLIMCPICRWQNTLQMHLLICLLILHLLSYTWGGRHPKQHQGAKLVISKWQTTGEAGP